VTTRGKGLLKKKEERVRAKNFKKKPLALERKTAEVNRGFPLVGRRLSKE